MPEPRLARDAPHLVEVLRRADPDERRRAALSACRIALGRHPRSEPAVEEGLSVLARPGATASPALLGELRYLLRELDLAHQGSAATGDGSPESQARAAETFGAARAVQALYLALRGDSFQAACDAVYEARAAGASPRDLQVAVTTAVRPAIPEPSTAGDSPVENEEPLP
jgi:hypothetical protein